MFRSVAFCFLLLLSHSLALAGEVRISAAASLTDALTEITEIYGRQQAQVGFVRNFASSGTLAKQLSAGAPADIFISADPKWIDFLRGQKLVATDSIQVLTHNQLVFVTGPEVPAVSLEELPKLERIAIGSPDSVPAGQYARQALSALGLFDSLLAAGKLVYAKDVRQALMYADRGEADGAFVYRTDALLARNAAIRFVVPADLYPEVTYPMALTPAGAQNPEAVAFFDCLQSAEARAVLSKHGFVVK
ncbi:molybdate ABC transporter substrate-binding protein [Trichloromonas sp.]|uniref:molybdate ABC transporter substrate-binding protein n=1 Tax=Trichloromonas sp. TaxID=3069249 RepID=UPI003D8129F9